MEEYASSISILHIDRNQLFREGVRRILSDSPFSVQGEASSLAEGLEQVPTLKPSVIIADTNNDSPDVLADLMIGARGISPQARVVILTDTVAIARLADALSAGVDGYLLKDMSPDALKQSLKLVLMGEKVFPTDLAYLLVNNRFLASGNRGHGGRNGTLSERETEILSCLVNGLSNKVIANQLQITEGTVKVHLKGILKKIQVQNRTQAAIWAIQHGIVSDVASPCQGSQF